MCSSRKVAVALFGARTLGHCLRKIVVVMAVRAIYIGIGLQR